LISLGGEQPIAACLIVDRSPSMGYRTGQTTRLSEAVRRALELLDDLPPTSRVAIIDPADPQPGWELNVADARTRLESFKEPAGPAVPVTAGLAAAYQLLKTVDAEAEATEPLPRLVAIFTDRTTASWDATRTDELKRLRESVPAPAVAHAVFDVGIDQPANVAILNAEIKPQIVPGGQTARVVVTVGATGPEVANAVVKVKLDDAAGERKAVPRIAAGSSQAVTFEFPGLARGVHQAEFSLETDDNLPADNVRFLTFRVAEPRKILTISDDPADAEFWTLAHAAQGDFVGEVRKPADAIDIAGFEIVALLNVADPPQALWDSLRDYLSRGGKVVLLPGPTARIASYSATANDLLPGSLQTVVKTVLRDSADPRFDGVTWALDGDLKHPLFAEYDVWRRQGNVELVKSPRKYWQYWAVEPAAGATVVANYDDDDDTAKRRPAILEKVIGSAGGRVLMLTSRLDPQVIRDESWNDFWRSPAAAVTWSHQIALALAGRTTDANFNYQTGDAVPLPRLKDDKAKAWQLAGPGVTAREATIEIAGNDPRLPASRTGTPGNFSLTAETAKDGYSVNAPTAESNLGKIETAAVESLTGPGSVFAVDRNVKFRELLETQFNQPVELFPWLVLFTVVGVAVEAVVASRFYRRT
jgi:hypothetical protein